MFHKSGLAQQRWSRNTSGKFEDRTSVWLKFSVLFFNICRYAWRQQAFKMNYFTTEQNYVLINSLLIF